MRKKCLYSVKIKKKNFKKKKRIWWKGVMAGQRGREIFVNVWWGNKG